MDEKAIRRIMVCVDGTEGATAALRFAIALAGATGAEVVAAHVLRPPHPVGAPLTPGAGMAVGRELESFEELTRGAIESEFAEVWCAPLREAGVRYRTMMRSGRAGPELVAGAEAQQVDLIVTGRRGRGPLNELLAGSVSRYLVHRAGMPVLVVPR